MPKIETTVYRTIGLDGLDDNSRKPLTALSKSIAFGTTNTWPANDVRWLQRQCTSLEDVSSPTCCKINVMSYIFLYSGNGIANKDMGNEF